MKIFGWKSTGRGLLRPAKTHVPLERRTPFASNAALGLGHWPRDYATQLREGYLSNPVAQRAVRLIAEGLASLSLKSSEQSAAAIALVRATSAGQSLLETVAAHLLLHGNAYIEIMSGADGSPCELYALRPERVTVEADARGWPASFLYRAGATLTRIPTDSIIHIRTMHPLDDHYGLGCLGAAAGPIAIHNAASKWNKALLDNAARPSGALVYTTGEGGAMSGDQYDRLKEELTQSFQGASNAGRPMLLEGGLSWQAMSMSPADMDFVALKSAAAREIALAFGVPPMLLGLPGDATYANYREANKALWRQAILPLATKILDALAQGLRPYFADLSLSVDLEQIPALADEREALWALVGGANVLTPNEKRDAMGYPPLEDAAPAPMAAEVGENKTGSLELKFNPWHDTQDGKFTAEGQGQYFGGRSPIMLWRGSGKAKNPEVVRSRGGSFGGGGASGSWDKPKPKRKQPPVKAQPQKRQNIKPRIVAAISRKPQLANKPVLAKRIARPKRAVRRISSGGYNFEVDKHDRTIRAYGELRLQPDQRRSRSAQRNAGKPDRLPKDHGGHFIGRQFGGPEFGYNHFAQNAQFNNSHYRSIENDWKKALKAGKKVRVYIRASYKRGSKRPHEIVVRFRINGRRQERIFSNFGKGN